MLLGAFLDVGLKNTTNIGRIERSLVVMGYVVEWGVLNEDIQKDTQGHW